MIYEMRVPLLMLPLCEKYHTLRKLAHAINRDDFLALKI